MKNPIFVLSPSLGCHICVDSQGLEDAQCLRNSKQVGRRGFAVVFTSFGRPPLPCRWPNRLKYFIKQSHQSEGRKCGRSASPLALSQSHGILFAGLGNHNHNAASVCFPLEGGGDPPSGAVVFLENGRNGTKGGGDHGQLC